MDPATLPLIPIVNEPLMPPRRGHEGEQIFLEIWQRFAREVPEDFESIFMHTRRQWNQRAASVAASFAMWLGTMGGLCFTEKAKRLMNNTGLGFDSAFIVAFALENTRTSWVNDGIRAIEFVMEEQGRPIHGKGWAVYVIRENVPEVTIHDLDVIECMCRWLASPQGQTFLRTGNRRIEAAREEHRIFGREPDFA